MSNGLTFAHLTIVATGSCGRFRTLTIPMDSVQSNQLQPHFVQQLDPKNLLQEAPLFKSNFYAIPSCNKRQLECQMKQVIENKINTDRHLSNGGIIPQVLSTGIYFWSLG